MGKTSNKGDGQTSSRDTLLDQSTWVSGHILPKGGFLCFATTNRTLPKATCFRNVRGVAERQSLFVAIPREDASHTSLPDGTTDLDTPKTPKFDGVGLYLTSAPSYLPSKHHQRILHTTDEYYFFRPTGIILHCTEGPDAEMTMQFSCRKDPPAGSRPCKLRVPVARPAWCGEAVDDWTQVMTSSSSIASEVAEISKDLVEAYKPLMSQFRKDLDHALSGGSPYHDSGMSQSPHWAMSQPGPAMSLQTWNVAAQPPSMAYPGGQQNHSPMDHQWAAIREQSEAQHAYHLDLSQSFQASTGTADLVMRPKGGPLPAQYLDTFPSAPLSMGASNFQPLICPSGPELFHQSGQWSTLSTQYMDNSQSFQASMGGTQPNLWGQSEGQPPDTEDCGGPMEGVQPSQPPYYY